VGPKGIGGGGKEGERLQRDRKLTLGEESPESRLDKGEANKGGRGKADQRSLWLFFQVDFTEKPMREEGNTRCTPSMVYRGEVRELSFEKRQ